MDFDGELLKFGFSTIRYVEAANPEEAELKAVEIVKKDESLISALKNDDDDSPMVYLDKLYEVENFGSEMVPGEGYTFYPEEKPWWKLW